MFKYKYILSVLMSVYNEKEIWLRESIESILNQTFSDFEFIIILDNPENAIAKRLIQEYKQKDKRIIFLENKINIGTASSKNKGLKIARGKYIAIMDADDISLKNRFIEQINFLKNNPNIFLVGSWAYIINEDGSQAGLMKITDNPLLLKKMIKYISISYHSSWMVKKEVYDKLKGYNESIPYVEDFDFLLRVIENNYLISNIKVPLIKYRIRFNQVSQRNSLKMQKIILYLKKIQYKNIKKESAKFSKEKLGKIMESSKLNKKLFQISNYYFIKAKTKFFKNNKAVFQVSFFLLLSFIFSPLWGGRRIYNIIRAKMIERSN